MLAVFSLFLLVSRVQVAAFSHISTFSPALPTRHKPAILTARLHDQSQSGGTSPTENINDLLSLCYASSLSYLPIDSIPSSNYASLATPHTLTPLTQIVEPATQSGATLFEYGANSIIVACRGSATPKNFATNLRFRLVPMPSDRFGTDNNARAHEGFQEAAKGLWERLEPHLLESGTKDLIFTGHSLGGGTAELCALYAATSPSMMVGGGGKSRVKQLTTFGGPCIGDSSFARYVNGVALVGADIRHVVHDADPILANNAPLWDKLGFERSGSMVKCDPYEAQVYDAESDAGSSYIPWNIIDHCKYMGVFVGPRLF